MTACLDSGRYGGAREPLWDSTESSQAADMVLRSIDERAKARRK